MAQRGERLNRALGRMVFRAFGTLFAAVALVCLYVAYRHATDWYEDSAAPAIMFGLIATAFGSVVPYSFSRKRTLAEALDAMEGGVGDLPRRPRR